MNADSIIETLKTKVKPGMLYEFLISQNSAGIRKPFLTY